MPEGCAVKIKRSHEARRFDLPAYASEGASGVDVRTVETAHIGPGESVCLATGLYLEIPAGFEAQVRPRSGLAFKHGLTVLNAPGTIDADYRGEVRVLLINHGREPVDLVPGERIAQLVFAPVTRVRFEEIADSAELAASERGVGGFGSTGTA